MKRLDAGQCPAATAAGLTRATLRHVFAGLAYEWDSRATILTLIHRLDRCGPQDAPVFAQLGASLTAPVSADAVLGASTALFTHIGLSELWDEPSPSLASLRASEADLLVCNGVGAQLGALHDAWPRLPHDAFHGAWAKTATPMLMLAGSLDPATPLADQLAAKTAFSGPHQMFVTVPRAPHGVIGNSPVTDQAAPDCGITLLTEFLADPTAELDTKCLADVAPLAFGPWE
jgi:pimeloyl-ACP methyl ester carboxylesterase